MSTRHNIRDNGAVRSNTHRSREQSRSQGRHVSSSSRPGTHYHANEGVSGPSMEERMRRMEEAQLQIIRLLRETQRPPTNETRLPINPRPTRNMPGGSRAGPPPQEGTLPMPGRDAELLDTASFTHPSHAPRLAPPHHAVIPDDVIRNELRRLVREEFPIEKKDRFHTHHNIHESSPLADAVLQHPIPTGFKLSNIDTYEGITDPYEHIDHYRTIMHIQRASDALLCQVFPATLKGQARTWFYSLSGGTVNTFNELAKLFVEQFIANRRIIKDSSHLSGIRQSEGESLKDYFRRFSTEARQIPGVDPELLRGVFLGGLRLGPFYSSLMRETVCSYADLVHRVEAQISADEAIITHKEQFERLGGKHKNNVGDTNQISQRKKFRPQGNRDQRSEKEYTPLNTSRVNILMAIKDEETVKWPKPLRNPNGGDQSQYCHFHRAKGHSTESCFQLKEEIERLIQQGHLGRYLQEQCEANQRRIVGVIE